MEIIYTIHADENIKDRKIDKKTIEGTIKKPDEILIGKNDRKIAHKIIENKLLRVIYEDKGKSYKVITAYLTKPMRYKK